MDTTKPIRTERGERNNFDVFHPPEGVTELYADGILGSSISPGTSKLELFTTIGVYDEKGVQIEERLVKYKLVMPTNVLVQSFNNVLKSIRQNKEAIGQGMENIRLQTLKILDGEPDKEKGGD